MNRSTACNVNWHNYESDAPNIIVEELNASRAFSPSSADGDSAVVSSSDEGEGGEGMEGVGEEGAGESGDSDDGDSTSSDDSFSSFNPFGLNDG